VTARAQLAAWCERHKPAAGPRTHRRLAAGLWLAVGLGLAGFGAMQTWDAGGRAAPLLLALAAAVGALKGRFVLARTARRNAARIASRGDGRCVGGFLSWRSWLLVAAMMFIGRTLRHAGIPGSVLGPIYVAVGLGLILGSLPLWRASR
jgi:hypothetical protein